MLGRDSLSLYLCNIFNGVIGLPGIEWQSTKSWTISHVLTKLFCLFFIVAFFVTNDKLRITWYMWKPHTDILNLGQHTKKHCCYSLHLLPTDIIHSQNWAISVLTSLGYMSLRSRSVDLPRPLQKRRASKEWRQNVNFLYWRPAFVAVSYWKEVHVFWEKTQDSNTLS